MLLSPTDYSFDRSIDFRARAVMIYIRSDLVDRPRGIVDPVP
jgi:hypothetical protein